MNAARPRAPTRAPVRRWARHPRRDRGLDLRARRGRDRGRRGARRLRPAARRRHGSCCSASSPPATSPGAPACGRNLRANWALLERDRHEHQRAVEGGARPRGAARRRPRARRSRRGRLRRHRGRQGGALLRGRVRRGAAHRLGRRPATRSCSSAARTSAPPPTSTASPGSPRAFLRPRGRTPRSTPTGSRREYLDGLLPPSSSRTRSRRSRSSSTRCATPRRGEPVLFFGVGPTLHHVFLAAGRASEIHLADYLPENLAEIERWLRPRPRRARLARRSSATRSSARASARRPTRSSRQREELTRAKVTRLLEADAGDREPVAERYATVVSAYCADSATADRATWETYMRHIAGLVARAACSSPRRCAAPAATSSAASASRAPTSTSTTCGAVLEPEFDAARSRSARCPSTRGTATRASCSSGPLDADQRRLRLERDAEALLDAGRDLAREREQLGGRAARRGW